MWRVNYIKQETWHLMHRSDTFAKIGIPSRLATAVDLRELKTKDSLPGGATIRDSFMDTSHIVTEVQPLFMP